MCELVVLLACAAWWGADARAANVTYGFYRELQGAGAGGTRRVFGGGAVQLAEFPAVCALLDRYFAPRCTGAVLAPHWALTAAHCVTSAVAYVKYDTRWPRNEDGGVTAVHYLYRHPEYGVLQKDEGRGLDVIMLHNDVGLVRSRDEIRLRSMLPPDPLAAIRRYDPLNLINAEVQVLGFGSTESTAVGEELYGARLRLVRCGRVGWQHVVCGAGVAGAGRRGVCAGDSGGPLLFARTQLAVTSMGPRECAGAGAPALHALSVFTALRPYVDVLNATIADTDAALRMRMISAASRPSLLMIIFLIYLWHQFHTALMSS